MADSNLAPADKNIDVGQGMLSFEFINLPSGILEEPLVIGHVRLSFHRTTIQKASCATLYYPLGGEFQNRLIYIGQLRQSLGF